LAHQIQKYLEAGMDAVVTKPIDVADLFGKIDGVLCAASSRSAPTQA
jgi:CheY-like chemotaxis protein